MLELALSSRIRVPMLKQAYLGKFVSQEVQYLFSAQLVSGCPGNCNAGSLT